jgi:hypothetical protein
MALGSLAYGAWHLFDNIVLRLIAAGVAPAAAVILWGRYVAPKARRRLPDPLRLLPELAVFGSAAAALVAAGQAVLGIGFACVVAISVILTFVLDQR